LCLPDSHVQALWTVSAVLFQQRWVTGTLLMVGFFSRLATRLTGRLHTVSSSPQPCTQQQSSCLPSALSGGPRRRLFSGRLFQGPTLCQPFLVTSTVKAHCCFPVERAVSQRHVGQRAQTFAPSPDTTTLFSAVGCWCSPFHKRPWWRGTGARPLGCHQKWRGTNSPI
jgi:hypothetical protein